MIAAEAKKEGLVLAEEMIETLAKAAYNGVKAWAKESAQLSTNKIDDLVVPFYGYLDSLVLPQIEKIDIDGSGS